MKPVPPEQVSPEILAGAAVLAALVAALVVFAVQDAADEALRRRGRAAAPDRLEFRGARDQAVQECPAL
jgi:hypothetical protein